MPVKKLGPKSYSSESQEMLKEILEEWRTPTEDCDKPIIILEDNGRDDPTHIYVLWDKWEGIPHLERSEIVMDACENVLGLEKCSRITVAMGLTNIEADRMKISFE